MAHTERRTELNRLYLLPVHIVLLSDKLSGINTEMGDMGTGIVLEHQSRHDEGPRVTESGKFFLLVFFRDGDFRLVGKCVIIAAASLNHIGAGSVISFHGKGYCFDSVPGADAAVNMSRKGTEIAYQAARHGRGCPQGIYHLLLVQPEHLGKTDGAADNSECSRPLPAATSGAAGLYQEQACFPYASTPRQYAVIKSLPDIWFFSPTVSSPENVPAVGCASPAAG